MPSPNGVRKTSAKKIPASRPGEFGEKLAKRKSQDFKSKIVEWNGTGAGINQEQDEVVVIEEQRETSHESAQAVAVVVDPDSDDASLPDVEVVEVKQSAIPATPKTPVLGAKAAAKQISAKKSREIDVDKRAWVRRKSKPPVEISSDLKEAVAPKKRVVSDGHWRRDRTQQEEASAPEKPKDTTPKPVTIRRSVVSVGLKIPPSVQDFVEESKPVRRRQLTAQSRSRSASRDRSDERVATPDYESSGMKVYVKRRRRSKSHEDARDRKGFSTSESSLTAPSSIDKPSTATDITTPDLSPKKELPPRPSTAPRERPSRRSADDGALYNKSIIPSFEGKENPRRTSGTKRNTIVQEEPHGGPSWKPSPNTSKAFKIPAEKPPPRPVPRVFGNRIQGWLAEMPDDPFTEPSDASLAPEPLHIHSKKPAQVEESDYEYDNSRRRSSGRSRRLQRVLDPIDPNANREVRTTETDEIDISSPATPTLKRSGARRNTHSPVKGRAVNDNSPQLDESTSSSDLPRNLSRRNTRIGLHDQPSPRAGNRLSTIASAESFQSRKVPNGPRERSNSSSRLTVVPDGSVLSRLSDGDEPIRNGGGLKRRLTKHSDLISVLSLPREDDHGITSARSIRTRRPKPETATIGDLMNEVTTEELKYQRELRTLVDGVIPVLLQYVLSKNDRSRTPGSRASSMQDNPALTQPIVEMGVALERLKASHKRISMHDPNELLLWAQGTAKVYAEYLRAWRLGFSDIVVNLAPAEETPKRHGSAQWDDGLRRNEHGDLLDGDGERVDVAYLLKRPLVRLKYLTKTFAGIDHIRPSALAKDMVFTYDDLVAEARRRANSERGRLEDEAAAAIDPTRARDPRSLAPLTGVTIDPTRNVKARDYFDLELFHSSGQQLGCKVELIMRDDFPGRGTAGDVLFCEVSESGRWLLFPPLLSTNVSARKGDKDGETIVMLRGVVASGSEWRELLSLQSSDDQGAEWLDILGSDPMPPRLTRQSSFNTLRGPSGPPHLPPSPTGSELPIGERANPTAQKWDGSEVNSEYNDTPLLNAPRAQAKRYRSTPSSPLTETDSWERNETGPGRPRYNTAASYDQRPSSGHARSKTEWVSEYGSSTQKKQYNVWLPSSTRGSDDESASEEDRPERRPTMRRRTSSVPSNELPTINKLRKANQQSTSKGDSDHEHVEPTAVAFEPATGRSKLQKRQSSAKENVKPETKKATPSSANMRPTSLGLRSGALPSFTPAFLKKHRRSSSPLKHEYEPSTATESSSESGLSDIDDVESVTSDSTTDEVISTIGDLKDFSKFGNIRPATRRAPSKGKDLDTLGPSDSPSQAPYRNVPPSREGSAKSVACIFSWSERGAWDNLHPEECEIVVTPGLIEAFDLTQAHAAMSKSANNGDDSPSTQGVRPLVALELTPLVPLRRGTALDISIRSPPTSDSLLRNSSNIMLRSRSPEECEKLYALINRARIDNPTWLALQNARGPVPTSNWAEVMDRRNAARSGSSPSWIKSLSRKGSSYRSKGTRSASIAASHSSVGSMGTAFNALRRFSGGGSRIFNVAKSTITSKEGTKSTYSDSLSSGAATPVPFDPSVGTPMGITNAKIRLYIRETASKWRDLGSARLTILLPPRVDPAAPVDPRAAGKEKRVLICGKSKGEMLLDATLGESCFERVARTGIAISVWEEAPNGEVGRVAATGGVMSSQTRVYMVQMRSERDAAYTFSMVGKLRY